MRVLFLISLVCFSTSVFSSEANFVCIKDGKVIDVKADTLEKKKLACEKENGNFTEEKPKQSAGKSGGW
jgi:Fe2+ or Zn2+ uptake regulation protein